MAVGCRLRRQEIGQGRQQDHPIDISRLLMGRSPNPR